MDFSFLYFKDLNKMNLYNTNFYTQTHLKYILMGLSLDFYMLMDASESKELHSLPPSV